MLRSLLALTLFGSLSLQAATYYVSPTGSDSNNGTSQSTPWLSIARVQQGMNSLNPGDQVLFQRGGTYRGFLSILRSGAAGSMLTFGAYGSGNDPIISGSQPVTNWTSYGNGIWQATLATAPTYVFAGGQLMTLARFPNTGWLRNENGSATSIHDDQLTNANGYWNGTQAVIRSTNWSYDVATISNYSGGTLTFPTIWYDLTTWDWGYFMQNKFEELDAAGEWFYDAAQQKLFFKPLNNADPNTLNIEAATQAKGFQIEWSRHHVKVENLEFRHQTDMAIRIDGGANNTIDHCVFKKTHKGADSYGNDNTYTYNTLQDVYATGLHLNETGAIVEHNTLTDVACVPGLGESNWGYQGIRVMNGGSQVRYNVLDRIGYNGIVVNGSTTCEYNRINEACKILNDGGGLGLDNCDGAILRKNIITNTWGDMESTATEHDNPWPIANGIYFGNISIKNSLVTQNTVSGCRGNGVYVDHTMLSEGNQITNNTLFNNTRQASFSDHSNYNGPGAVYPYYMANYDDVFTGNIMVCTSADQLCLRWTHVWTNGVTDFGTFENNVYYNPYNDQVIVFKDHFNGNRDYRYTLAQWQSLMNKDLASTTDAKQWMAHDVTAELSSNLVVNGDFNYNVNGWDGWPNNATVALDYSYLDNGALKANLPDNSQYGEFIMRNPDAYAVQNGQWYYMSFSIQSDIHGEVLAGVKGMTQMAGQEVVHMQYTPFGPQRRDVEFVFQSDLSDNALCQFVNQYTLPRYWLDNVELKRVTVDPVNAMDRQMILVNDQSTTQSFPLTGCWSDPQGNYHSGSVDVNAFRSIVLTKEDEALCGLSTGTHEIIANTASAVALQPNPVAANGQLSFAGVTATTRLEVYDMTGSIVRTETLTPATNTITLDQHMPPGAYVARLTGNATSCHRIVVR